MLVMESMENKLVDYCRILIKFLLYTTDIYVGSG